MNASYVLFCTWTARLYIFPSITRFTEPAAMITASMHKSRRPESWKREPIIDITLQIVWNLPRRSMMLTYWLAYKAWSMITMMSFKYSICRMFSGCFKISETVDISVAGAFIVGIYPIISREMLKDALIVMLNSVQFGIICVTAYTCLAIVQREICCEKPSFLCCCLLWLLIVLVVGVDQCDHLQCTRAIHLVSW